MSKSSIRYDNSSLYLTSSQPDLKCNPPNDSSVSDVFKDLNDIDVFLASKLHQAGLDTKFEATPEGPQLPKSPQKKLSLRKIRRRDVIVPSGVDSALFRQQVRANLEKSHSKFKLVNIIRKCEEN